MKRFLVISCLVILIFFASLSLAAIPKMINYQGMLTDNSSTPLTGSYNLTFKIWTDTTGGVLCGLKLKMGYRFKMDCSM